ncbi:MAG: diversity-generating retroelement protein bAvd family protein [Acidobacteria bacterium]|nr:MAG: diversity-generating retroelement protein bAvd family protein [Acidobacteriota bacterium]
MQDFRKLAVWRKAHEAALLTYRLTADFPRDELFGLRNSLRKTSVDIPAYIAESCGKPTGNETGKAIVAAIALANRLEYYALIARDLRLLTDPNHDLLRDAVIEVRKMLSGFAKRVEG